ncbi:hypothetical protein VN24_18075 [Paenibacillus beijingensis]|uniref:Chemotaxis protein n=2 Tax=Paenibacillus beijingensis TaxID=1126833 RepID=A0A0D5NSF3_9BACL|nr:hypothetical protein VN24_18075 [Paenibacillus beijingensis]
MSKQYKTAEPKQQTGQPNVASEAPSERKSQFLGAASKIKLRNPFKSVGSKLFIIIFSSILFCVLAVGVSSYNLSRQIISNKVSDSSLGTIEQMSKSVNLVMNNIETRSMQFITDPQYKSAVANFALSSGQSESDRYLASINLTNLLQSIQLSDGKLQNIYLLPVDNKGDDFLVGTNQLDMKAVRQTQWYKEAMEGAGAPVWTSTQINGFDGKGFTPTLGLARALRNFNTGTPVFVLLIEVKTETLKAQFDGVNLGAGSKIQLLDGANNILIDSADEKMVGKPAFEVLGAQNSKEASGKINTDTPDGEELIVYNTLDSSDWRLAGLIPVDQLVKDAGKIFWMTLVMAGVAALLALLIGFMVIRNIAKPLNKLSQLMNEGKEGNLSVRASVKSKDEIGQLAASFNEMMVQITALVDQTRESASQVLLTAGELSDVSKQTAISAREIAVATEEIATGATSLAVEAERGSDLTGGIESRMKQVITANDEMGVSAHEVERASQQGTTYMNGLIEKTGLTEQMTRSMVEKVDHLKESTGSIRKILDVLNNLTKQTNILSLNATIEAARAGAAGKGFMVVADEIRQLADQSRQSINVVAEITEKIQREIDETVGVLSEAYPLFQQQIGAVKEANQIFLSVQSQMTSFVERLESVTESIGGLDESQSRLTIAMSNVSAVAQQSSATSEQVASLSTEQLGISDGLVKLSDKLEMLSKGLQGSLLRFKV